MSVPKFPKPEQVKLSPEAQRALSEFVRIPEEQAAAFRAGAARALRGFADACERARKARRR